MNQEDIAVTAEFRAKGAEIPHRCTTIGRTVPARLVGSGSMSGQS